jgi:hypothetical protein
MFLGKEVKNGEFGAIRALAAHFSGAFGADRG